MFLNDATVEDNDCIGVFATNGSNASDDPCPTATGFSANDVFALGPMPAGGATVSNLFAVANATPSGAQTHDVEVIILTATPTVVLSCTVTSAGSTCSNTD